MSEPSQKVLITGSSGAFGNYLVDAFLQDGWSVTGIDRATTGNAHDSRGAWNFIECDITDQQTIAGPLSGAQDTGPFDVVINNAGLIYSAPLLAFEGGALRLHDFDAWNKVLAATLSSAFYVSAHCAYRMVTSGKSGVIINISSICAEGNVGQAAYSAAKAGVNAMTVSLSKELGSLGIRVAAIAPGFFDTASTRRAMSEEALRKIRKSIPLGRLGEPRHLYHAVKFIIDNGYFHGKVLELDGGLTI